MLKTCTGSDQAEIYNSSPLVNGFDHFVLSGSSMGPFCFHKTVKFRVVASTIWVEKEGIFSDGDIIIASR